MSDYTVEERGFGTPCWVWRRKLDSGGYGQDAANRMAHRIHYERLVGPIPEGMQLDHLCRVRACINPDHLEPVTLAVNCQRGRNAKLTTERAQEIRLRYAAGGLTQAQLATAHGVSPDTISRVVNGKGWR